MADLILGTANFANEYGIANNGERILSDELRKVINWAQHNGINHFDSAIAYGDSDWILKTNLDQTLEPLIDSKLDEKSCQSKELILDSAIKIRQRLGISQISVLYLHDETLLGTPLGSEVVSGLRDVLDRGIAKKVGVSVYSEEFITLNKEALPELSVFQVPENICDRRLIYSKEIAKLSEEGNTFNIRSIFLQGLLLMNPASLPLQFKSLAPNLQTLNEFANKNATTVLDLCLAYAKSICWANGIVVGVTSLNQLMEIHCATSTLPDDWESFVPKLPIKIIDPRRWS